MDDASNPKRLRQRSPHRNPAALLLTLALFLVTVLLNHFTFVLQVRFDGEVIGTVPDAQVLEELIDTAEEAVETLRGAQPQVAERVSYSLRLASVTQAETLDTEVVEQSLFYHIDGVDLRYVILVDGEPLGAVYAPEKLHTAMEERLQGYIEAGANTANFLSDVEYDFQLIDLDSDLPLDADGLLALVSTFTVETIEHITYTEPIPYEITIIPDDTRFDDETELIQEGEDGKSEITAEITYIDGEAIQYEILQTKILIEALPQIIIAGTLERPLTASWGEYIWPAEGRLSSGFGPRRVAIGSSNHQGIDISAPAGTPVIAADGGEVIFTGWLGGFGNLIRIRHDNDHVTYYAHLSSIDTRVGDRVYRGQFIGRVGMTGTASGNHLHFEIRINGRPVDPAPWLP